MARAATASHLERLHSHGRLLVREEQASPYLTVINNLNLKRTEERDVFQVDYERREANLQRGQGTGKRLMPNKSFQDAVATCEGDRSAFGHAVRKDFGARNDYYGLIWMCGCGKRRNH